MKNASKSLSFILIALMYTTPHPVFTAPELKRNTALTQAMGNVTNAHKFMTLFYYLYFGTPERETGPSFPGIASVLQSISLTYFKLGTPLAEGYMSLNPSNQFFSNDILIQQGFLNASPSLFKEIIPRIKRTHTHLKKSLSRTYFNYVKVKEGDQLIEKKVQGPFIFHHLSMGSIKTATSFQSMLQRRSLLLISKTEQLIKLLKKAYKSYFDAILAYSEQKAGERGEKPVPMPSPYPSQRSHYFHGYMG